MKNTRYTKNMKYKKKPVVVDAYQYNGDIRNADGDIYIPYWMIEAFDNGILNYDFPHGIRQLYVKTLSGILNIEVGDYIIKGINGELYVCKPDIFEETYDAYDEHEVCKVCKSGHLIKQNYVLMSDPPQDVYKCDNCGSSTYSVPASTTYANSDLVEHINRSEPCCPENMGLSLDGFVEFEKTVNE